jgi:hypothetical protein
MIAQVSREKKMAGQSYVPLSTLNRTRELHDGNEMNDLERNSVSHLHRRLETEFHIHLTVLIQTWNFFKMY